MSRLSKPKGLRPQPSEGHYDLDQPWICWWFLHADWVTRATGRSRVRMECAICGKQTVLSMRIPRFGPVPVPKGGKHVQRLRFMHTHVHPDQPHPMAWAKPLRNPDAFGLGGIPLDLLAMRLEADLLAAGAWRQ